MQTSHKPGKGWLIASHAIAVILGAAGAVVVDKTTERTVVIKPMLDLGQGEPVPLGRLLGVTSEARISANENAAIATLRFIAASQQQFQACCAVDTDADGGGEYGFFGELAGSAVLRAHDPTTGFSAFATGEDALLDPPFLASAFGHLVEDGMGHGVIERQGYYFKLYLPGRAAGEVIPGVPENPTGGARERDLAAGWNSSDCEILWCAYAWPVTVDKTGNRTFFVNQEWDLLQYDNRDADYEGLASPPGFGAAYSDGIPDSMIENLGLAVMGFDANDGNVWTAVE